MQISIDASTATPTALRLTAAILTFVAGFKENPQNTNPQFPLMVPQSSPVVAPPAPPAAVVAPTPLAVAAPVQEPVAVAPTPPAGIVVEAGLFDSNNQPWNPELHTANQSTNADGTWRRKRTNKGEAPSTAKVVELPPQVPPPPPAPSVEPQTTVEPIVTAPPAPVTAPVAAAVPPAPPVSTVAPNNAITTFQALVKFATNLVGTKKISTSQLLEACEEVGVPDLHACSLPENTVMIPLVATAIGARVKA